MTGAPTCKVAQDLLGHELEGGRKALAVSLDNNHVPLTRYGDSIPIIIEEDHLVEVEKAEHISCRDGRHSPHSIHEATRPHERHDSSNNWGKWVSTARASTKSPAPEGQGDSAGAKGGER